MVLADLGRKITSALQSLSKATVINEEVSVCSSKSCVKLKKTTNHPVRFALCESSSGRIVASHRSTRCLPKATEIYTFIAFFYFLGFELYAKGNMRSSTGGRCEHSISEEIARECTCRYRL